jgi:hypothetical protein
MSDFWVHSIVSQRDNQPYVQLSNEEGVIAQLSMAQARTIAQDILVMCSRAEADAMVLKFFDKNDFPEGAAAAIMTEFRDFRAALDNEKVERSQRPTDSGEKP